MVQFARHTMVMGIVLDHAKKFFLPGSAHDNSQFAAAASLAGQRGLPPNIKAPPNPEAIRGAKEWLSDHMPGGRRYSERLDQPAFTALFDLQAARCIDSFDKCYRDVIRLLSALMSGP